MTARADHVVPLKLKQRRLLDLFRAHGPISIRAVTPHIHGDDKLKSVKLLHSQAENLCARGLIKPVRIGEREHGARGVRPLLWVACEVAA